MSATRNCTICGSEKPLENFSLLKSGKNGRHAHCKQCRSLQRKAYNYPKPYKGRHTCPKCTVEKDISAFNGDKSSKNGLQTYCKLCQSTITSKRANTLEGFIGYLFRHIIANAKTRGIGVFITKEDILNLYTFQGVKCALSGIEMTHIKKANADKWADTTKNISVDRIDSKREYIIDNIQLVCAAANIIKWDLPQNEFIEMCRLVTEYQYGIKICHETELIFRDYSEVEN